MTPPILFFMSYFINLQKNPIKFTNKKINASTWAEPTFYTIILLVGHLILSFFPRYLMYLSYDKIN